MSKTAGSYPNQQLRWERQRRGWSRAYVAEQIGLADAKTLGRWERGVSFPRSYFLQKLCVLFGMAAQDLGLYPTEDSDGAAVKLFTTQHNARFAGAAPHVYDPALPLPLIEIDELVGRDELLSFFKERLCAAKRPRASALYGLPGVGKTALAIELAYDRDVQHHFSDGVLWVEPGPRPDVPAQLRRWCTLLGCATADMANATYQQAWAGLLRSAIGERRMLLIIDDAWSSADALAFKVGGPNCAYLLTTRIPFVALQFANDGAVTVRELHEEAGMRLLAWFVPDIVSAEPSAARALVQCVGGLPLALTLIGKYLQRQACTCQPRRLHAALARLLGGADHSPHGGAAHLMALTSPIENHLGLSQGAAGTLEAVIGMSMRQLNEQTRSALAMLSAFPAKPRSFSEEAALAVSGAPLEILDALIDAGLLECCAAGRYTLHRTIADYARLKRRDSAADERMVAYYIHYVETHHADYDALDQEMSNILAALQVAFEHGMHAALMRGALACAPFLRSRGLHEVAEIHLKRAEIAHSLDESAAVASMLYDVEERAECL